MKMLRDDANQGEVDRFKMEHKIWNSVRLIIYRPFHQPISQIQDGTQDLILFSLTNLSVVIDDLFQVKSLQSNDFVKIQRGVQPIPNSLRRGNGLPPLKPLIDRFINPLVRFLMDYKIWNSVIYRPFHQPIRQVSDG